MKIIYSLLGSLLLICAQSSFANPQWDASFNFYNVAAKGETSLKGPVTFTIMSRAYDVYSKAWSSWKMEQKVALDPDQSFVNTIVGSFGSDRIYQVGVLDVSANGVTLHCSPDVQSTDDQPNMTVTNQSMHQMTLVVEWYKNGFATESRCFWVGNYYQ